jgi:excinuclease ABC subunit C
VRRLPAAPGVYRFRDSQDRVLYLGRAVDVRRRAASYWTALGDRGHLVTMVARTRRVEAVVCDSAHEAAWLERNLLERELPPWNRTRGGQEAPVYICLRVDRTGPRLSVVREPPESYRVRCFGPYLGGLQVRRAVAALRRVFAIEDFARARGLDTTDPAQLEAVLGREPAAVDAVRATLQLRREDAAARLAFEAAAQIQADIEAVVWVLAEQKVSVLAPLDLDVHGWANGVLVRFRIRGGRMSEWDGLRGVPAAAADDLVARTPAEWRPFAYRNALLAASLP